MKKIYLLVIGLALIITGCSPSGINANTPKPTEDKRLSPMKKYAAEEFGISQSEIVLASMTKEEWPDACLGLPEKDEMCAMVVTPGYLVIFNSPKGTIEFHTNQDLSYYRMAPVGSPSKLLSWQRSGGFAGICENLEIWTDNSFTLTDCSGTILAQGAITEADAAELTGYFQKFTVTDWFSKQPAGSADMFSDHFILYGKGNDQPSDSQMVEMNEWIANLADRLKQQGLQPNSTGDSGIEGQVTIGPTCPGPVQTGDTGCTDKPYVAWLSILDSTGKVIARVESDENGRYSISLVPGQYMLLPESQAALSRADQQEVEINSGVYTIADIHYDSGIR